MATATKAKSGKAKPGRKKQTKKKAVTFYSRSPNQRLVFEFGDVIRNERGRVVETIPSKSVEFEDQGLGHGVYVWDPTDDDREDWERSDELLEWLREHPTFNTGGAGAFWERGSAPDEPEPKLADQIDAINDGLFTRDREAVEAVLATERDTHNREVVIDAGEAALTRLDEEGDGQDAEPSPETSPAS